MANTLKLGAGKWATGTDTVLAFNDLNNNFKPLPFDFSRASSATVVNQSGLIETVGSGEPRIDFLGNTKGALLLEPQRTNAIRYSSDFSQWSLISNVTINSNVGLAPDGTLSADRIVFNGTTNARVEDTAQGIDAFSYTNDRPNSVWLKSESGTTTVRFGSSSSYLLTVTVTEEWQRFTYISKQGFARIRSDNATSVLAWGYQFETNGDVSLSYATSYIPTSGSAVTRVSDTCSQTVPNGVSLSTTGTVFLDYTLNIDLVSAAHFPFSITDYNNNSSNEWLTRGSFRFTINTNGSVTYEFVLLSAAISTTTTVSDIFTSIGSRGKMAVSWNGTNVTFSVNGVNYQDTLSTNFTGSLDGIYLGVLGTFNNTYKGGQFNDIKLYNTRLSNAELQALTTI